MRGSIKVRTRILCLLMAMAIGAAGAVALVAGVEMRRLTRAAQEQNALMGQAIAEQAGDARAKALTETYEKGAALSLSDELSAARRRLLISLCACALLALALSRAFTGNITHPLNRLLRDVRRMGGGDLSAKVEKPGRDEVGELGAAFNQMTDDLRAYIASFTKAEKEKERLNGELSIAASIQSDMLPGVKDLGESDSIRIFAKMAAAKEVGGDFYDFFYLDEERTRIAFLIADVSGKGVPAALFMMIAKTLLKTRLTQGDSPAKALMSASDTLARDNASNMFVTALAWVLDLKTGKAVYANAGHNPPLRGAGGTFEYMKIRRSMPLAAIEGIRYRDEEITLSPGDTVFLYTDGVTEAMSEENELFGEGALLAALREAPAGNPEALDACVREKLRLHAGRAEQSDDITTLAVYYAKEAV